ncbi:hypothetical protein DFQ27_007207 [Actinomortierella ambigua]|uniref:Uncharacterized protein n=1 Tax=Actinomortierella ambigua TaxID=1343610 RepID=A0A9P6PTK0_9FUNG|nr:hypothetical protein DFQ27_007207 [Actinomortierella ambigua]
MLPTEYPFHQVDVFTGEGYYGNPLAVVVALDPALPIPGDETMLRFAQWTNLSETTFLLPPSDPSKADYRVRIFTKAGELPFAGHPTLGTCKVFLLHTGRAVKAAMSTSRSSSSPPSDHLEIVQECSIGFVRIRVSSTGQGKEMISFIAPPLLRSGPVEEEKVMIACEAMGLDRSRDVMDTQWIVTGSPWFALLVKDVETVMRAKRTPTAQSRDLKFGIIGQYRRQESTVTAPRGSEEQPLFEVRTFPHAGNVDEDPITGAFNAGMATWLIRSNLAPARYIVSQGTALGRCGRVLVERDDDDLSKPESRRDIWIGGEVVSCIEGTVRMPKE